MRAWVVEVGEPLPIDPGDPRLMRAGLLVERLARRGHEVVWWTSAFDHYGKRNRPVGIHRIERKDFAYELVTLPSPGYDRHVSVRRIVDHMANARGFVRLAPTYPVPDVVCAGLPTTELAAATARFARQVGARFVVDIRDLWPDVFERALPAAVRPLARLAFRPFERQANRACRGADAIVAVNADFLEWGLRRAHRAATGLDVSFPLAYERADSSDAQLESSSLFWEGWGLSPATPTVAFVGSFTSQFRFDAVVGAARVLSVTRPGVRIVLCGAGPREAELRRSSSDLDNLVLPGWVDSPKIAWLLSHAVVGLAPYRPSPDFESNYPNKIIEYLAYGVPVVTSLQHGATASLLSAAECGHTYAVDDATSLVAALDRYLGDTPMRTSASSAASRVYAQRFRADVVYGEYAQLLEGLAQMSRVVTTESNPGGGVGTSAS